MADVHRDEILARQLAGAFKINFTVCGSANYDYNFFRSWNVRCVQAQKRRDNNKSTLFKKTTVFYLVD